MASKVTNDLGFLGEEFQVKLVKFLIEDPKAFMEIYGVLEQNAFTIPELRTIVGMYKDYYNSYGTVPTYKMIELTIRDKFKDAIDTEVHLAYVDKIRKCDSTGREVLIDKAKDFFKQQRFIYLFNKAMDKMKNGYTDSTADTLITHLYELRYGKTDAISTNPFDFVPETLTTEREVRVPTGLKELDAAMDGGHPKGNFGIIQGNAGCGKTTIATMLASNAAVAGYKVIQIFFEDKEVDIYRKHYAYITPGLVINDFNNPADKAYVQRLIEENPKTKLLKENLQVLKLPTGEKTIEDIEFEIRKITNVKGFVPDVVIIDYFDCIKLSSNAFVKDKYEAETRLARKLENFASRNNIALWVMHQGNRSGESEVGATTVQGAYTKQQICHTYITVFRTKEDRINNRARITFNKARSNDDSADIIVHMDNGAMEFDDNIPTNHDLEWKPDDDDINNNSRYSF